MIKPRLHDVTKKQFASSQIGFENKNENFRKNPYFFNVHVKNFKKNFLRELVLLLLKNLTSGLCRAVVVVKQ